MRWLACVLGACLTVGCTDRSTDDGTGDSAADGSGTATGGGSGDSTGSTGGAETTGGPDECLPPAPEIGPAVTLRIVNAQTFPVYIPDTFGCAVLGPFEILREDAPVSWQYEACTSCEAAVDGACGCPAACPIDSVIRLDPGGIWEGSWPGSEAMQVTLAPGCTDEFCGPQCTTSIAAAAGEYTVQVQTAIEVDCGGGPCDCLGDPDPGGWCRVTGSLGSEQAAQVRTLVYPDETSVDVEI